MDGLQCSRLKVATATKVVVAGERPDPGASSSSHHRIIASSARCRRTFGPAPCLKTIGAQGFGGCLPCAQRRYTKRSACSTWDVTVGARHDCLRNSCARALGILSIVIVVVVMEDEVRFFWWLFLFRLCLIEEGAIEVLVAPSFRCDARVFPPLRRHAEPMRRFVVLRRRSSSALSRHTDSAKNCMACCWIEMRCKVLYHSLHGPHQPWGCLS